MQEENTNQTENTDTGAETPDGIPELSLSGNPSGQQDSPAPAVTSDDTGGTDTSSSSDDSSAVADSAGDTSSSTQPSTPVAEDDLDAIRDTALHDLAPIVNKLDQDPEDKYRTLMMLIQSSDDQSLLKEAYSAAHNIEDEKTRAEALLTIIDEINYFKGKGKKPEEE
ncbi:MAG TPA: hypothetical protein VFK11_00135 [Candidatus Saccharimonadales bacterium]|nr:hypothetical protein [Candidatus Saccharimonadales bacterium]